MMQRPPQKLHQRPIHHERRLEENHLVARIDQRHQRQHEGAAGAARHAERSARLAKFLPHLGLEPVTQGRNALRGRVAIFAGVNRRLGRLPGLGRHGKVGLADGEIDRILELGGQIEGLADAGGIKGTSPFGNDAASIHAVGPWPLPRNWK